MSADLERFVISQLLQHDDSFGMRKHFLEFLDKIRIESSDFSTDSLRSFFDKYKELLYSKKAYDVFSIIEALPLDQRQLGWILSQENMSALPQDVESAIISLKQTSNKRKLLALLDKAKFAIDKNESVDEQLKKIDDLLNNNQSYDPIERPKELALRFMVNRSKPHQARIDTGFLKYDSLLFGGFKRGSLNTLAARPGVGKTSFACNIVNHIANHSEVLFFSIEMTNDDLAEKIGALNHENIVDGINRFASKKISFVRTNRVTVPVIERISRSMNNQNKLSLIVIDYLGLIKPIKKTQNKAIEIADMTRDLKCLAMELDLPILLLCQMNRSIDSESREPRLSDLRDSGGIEQDSDTVTFLIRHLVNDTSTAGCLLAKNRFGATGLLPMHFNCNRQIFTEV